MFASSVAAAVAVAAILVVEGPSVSLKPVCVLFDAVLAVDCWAAWAQISELGIHRAVCQSSVAMFRPDVLDGSMRR